MSTATHSNKVFIAGCFDGIGGLHAGHKFILDECKKLGDVYVGVNDDCYIRQIKNRSPICNQEERLVKVLEYGVKDARLFSGTSPLNLILEIQPRYIVVGDDYKPENVVGYNECREWGGEVVCIGRIPKISTSILIKKNSLLPNEIVILNKFGIKFDDRILYSAIASAKIPGPKYIFSNLEIDNTEILRISQNPLLTKKEKNIINNLISRNKRYD